MGFAALLLGIAGWIVMCLRLRHGCDRPGPARNRARKCGAAPVPPPEETGPAGGGRRAGQSVGTGCRVVFECGCGAPCAGTRFPSARKREAGDSGSAGRRAGTVPRENTGRNGRTARGSAAGEETRAATGKETRAAACKNAGTPPRSPRRRLRRPKSRSRRPRRRSPNARSNAGSGAVADRETGQRDLAAAVPPPRQCDFAAADPPARQRTSLPATQKLGNATSLPATLVPR